MPELGSAINGGLGLAADATAGQFLANGLIGGLTSVAGGGNFGSGFLAGGVGSLAGPLTGGGPFDPAKALLSAALGGVASVLGGGKFANGALTGAFAYAAKTCTSGGCNSSEDYKYPVTSNMKDIDPETRLQTITGALDSLHLIGVGFGPDACGSGSACIVIDNSYKVENTDTGDVEYVNTVEEVRDYEQNGYTSVAGTTAGYGPLGTGSIVTIYAAAAQPGAIGGMSTTGFFTARFVILHEMGHVHSWYGGGGFSGSIWDNDYGDTQVENEADEFAMKRWFTQ